jgi:hypothetical protein
MKLFLIAALVSSTSAFSPVALPGRHSSALFSAVDSSDAVKAALAASKEFGPTSKEAALAWDIVEEMDASDNRCVCVYVFDGLISGEERI